MRTLLHKHNLKYTPKDAPKPALDLFDAATLAQRIRTLEAEQHHSTLQLRDQHLRNVGLHLELQEAKAAVTQAQQAVQDSHLDQQSHIARLEAALAITEDELNSKVSQLAYFISIWNM
jgi:hypothetical protein